MARKPTEALAILLAVLACIEVSFSYGFGFGREMPDQTLTNIGPKNESNNIRDCLAPIQSVAGCFESVSEAISGEDLFFHIAPHCCQVVNAIDVECWSFLFPNNSSAPAVIGRICEIIGRKKAAHFNLDGDHA